MIYDLQRGIGYDYRFLLSLFQHGTDFPIYLFFSERFDAEIPYPHFNSLTFIEMLVIS